MQFLRPVSDSFESGDLVDRFVIIHSVMMCCPEFFAEVLAACSLFVWVCVAGKGVWWMPWQTVPMKDVWGRDRPRGAADRALIRGFPNGETRRPYGPAPHSCGGYAGK